MGHFSSSFFKNLLLIAHFVCLLIKLIKQMIGIPCWGPRLFIWLPSNSDTLSELFGATSLMY